MSGNITEQNDRTRLFQMEIRKHKMLPEEIETRQRSMGQQLVNQRTENEATGQL
jgi:hypothetical protein